MAARKLLACCGDCRDAGEPGEFGAALLTWEPEGDSPKSGSVCPLSSRLRLTDVLLTTDELSSLPAGDGCLICKDSPGDPFPLGRFWVACTISLPSGPRPLDAWFLTGLLLKDAKLAA